MTTGACTSVACMCVCMCLLADLDGVMPTHVQDVLPIPEELAGRALCIAAMQAHSYFRYVGLHNNVSQGDLGQLLPGGDSAWTGA